MLLIIWATFLQCHQEFSKIAQSFYAGFHWQPHFMLVHLKDIIKSRMFRYLGVIDP